MSPWQVYYFVVYEIKILCYWLTYCIVLLTDILYLYVNNKQSNWGMCGSRGIAPLILNLEMSGYHDPTALARKWIEQEFGWAPGLVWAIWRREKFVTRTGIRKLHRPAHGLVIRPTQLRRSPHLYTTFGSIERLNSKKFCTGIVSLMLNNLTKNMNVLQSQWPYVSPATLLILRHPTQQRTIQYNTIQCL